MVQIHLEQTTVECVQSGLFPQSKWKWEIRMILEPKHKNFIE
jgi:hypothetical protein